MDSYRNYSRAPFNLIHLLAHPSSFIMDELIVGRTKAPSRAEGGQQQDEETKVPQGSSVLHMYS